MPLVDLRDLMCSSVIFVHESHGAGDKTVPVPQRDSTWYNITTIFHQVVFPNMFSIVMHIACPSLVSFINILNKNTCLYLQHLYYKISMCVGNTMSCNVMLCGFLPYQHSLMGVLLCLCHTHLSRKWSSFFFEVIVLTEKTESPLQR